MMGSHRLIVLVMFSRARERDDLVNYRTPDAVVRLKARFVDWVGFLMATSFLVLARPVLVCCGGADTHPPIL